MRMHSNENIKNNKIQNEWKEIAQNKQWTPEERYQFLKRIILLCSKDECKDVFKFLKTLVPETAVDFTRILPQSISLYIFSFLDPRSLCRACQVSHYWKILCESNTLWGPKCLSLGWQLPSNTPFKPEFDAYKKLYIENIRSLRLAELRKIRRKIALEQQREEEEKRNDPANQRTRMLKSTKNYRNVPPPTKIVKSPLKKRLLPNKTEPSKSPVRETSVHSHKRTVSGRLYERIWDQDRSMKEVIADVTERLSAPLERRRRNSISHAPIQHITRDDTNKTQWQSSLPRRKLKLPASMIVAPPGQKFAPLSPDSIKSLPPPPNYEPRPKGWTPKKQEIYDIIKDVPS